MSRASRKRRYRRRHSVRTLGRSLVLNLIATNAEVTRIAAMLEQRHNLFTATMLPRDVFESLKKV